ncbi:transport and Golgi organization protein 6, partial [Asbolus verrucosus]
YEGDFEVSFQNKYEVISEILSCTYDDVSKKIAPITSIYDTDKITYEWKYICLNFYILELLNDELSKSHLEVLSVQEIKKVKTSLANFLLIGVLKNLQPNLPHFVRTEKDHDDVVYTYNVLKCTTLGLSNCIKHPNLRMLILPHFLQGILMACLQVANCPLKKPTKDSTIITEATYNKFLEDQQLFKNVLNKLRQNIHPAIFVKETMSLFQSNSPTWFKKAVSNILTKMLRSEKGVENIALAMLDGRDDDTAQTWKILDVLTKLVMSCRKFPDFRQNICAQVLNLLDSVKAADLFVFERLVISCTKVLHSEDKELCEALFFQRIITPLLYFAYKEHKFRESDDVTDDVKQTIRLVYGCFVDNSANPPCLPMELLKSLVNVVFHFYHITVKSPFQATNKELKELLIKYLHCCESDEVSRLFDNFLFGFDVADVLRFRTDVIVEIAEKITVRRSDHTVIDNTEEVADALFSLLDVEQKIVLFGYLLNCIIEKATYFPTSSNKELLTVEEEACTVVERLLTTHRLLSQLADSKEVQASLNNKPENIVKYINNVLRSDSDDSQFIFTIVMILDNLVANASADGRLKYQILLQPLAEIASKTSDAELRHFCDKIATTITEKKAKGKNKCHNEATEFEKALEDVCDPLLPTRGHALLVLSKLVEKKDKEAMERKQYLLNLFQLSLKDEDSFIYLNAVQGLAALADVFPDTVLEVLCEEYADFAKKSEETRLKLGEVLVRVVKSLGEMAPKYKSLLLNTFLSGSKDDDHLIRASSLSNLGEVCRVLGYKLGTIATEVLVCVHAVIATDKAAEARRAALTVIRQLFVGLRSEMIAFLKEDILPIYRTLKEVYCNDRDDVMRLQAQLALEELNENMKTFVFPNPELSFEKKVVMLG